MRLVLLCLIMSLGPDLFKPEILEQQVERMTAVP